MSDFSDFYAQQMQEPIMRELMEETNALIGRPQDGSKRLAEMDLSKEEKERIFRILDDPRYLKAKNAILMKVLGKNRWIRLLGSYIVQKYHKAFLEMAKVG